MSQQSQIARFKIGLLLALLVVAALMGADDILASIPGVRAMAGGFVLAFAVSVFGGGGKHLTFDAGQNLLMRFIGVFNLLFVAGMVWLVGMQAWHIGYSMLVPVTIGACAYLHYLLIPFLRITGGQHRLA